MGSTQADCILKEYPTTRMYGSIMQVDQSGASLTVTLFSIGGITWSSVTFQAPSLSLAPPPTSELPPPSGSSSRRMLLQAPPGTSSSPPTPMAEVSHAAGILASQGEPYTSRLRSLQQASGAKCTPAVTRCATRVMPPLGEGGN